MTAVSSTALPSRNYGKLIMFGVMGLMALSVIYADEKFLFIPTDKEWAHIAAFKWWLLPHALAGATALVLGPFQFSERFRTANFARHRLMGRIYIGAICIASLLSIYITLKFEPPAFQLEIWAQGGGWLLCAVLALTYAMKRNIAAHRQWVARSYGFTFIFVGARIPDVFAYRWASDADFVDFLWMLVFLALVVPDLILQSKALFRTRSAA